MMTFSSRLNPQSPLFGQKPGIKTAAAIPQGGLLAGIQPPQLTGPTHDVFFSGRRNNIKDPVTLKTGTQISLTNAEDIYQDIAACMKESQAGYYAILGLWEITTKNARIDFEEGEWELIQRYNLLDPDGRPYADVSDVVKAALSKAGPKEPLTLIPHIYKITLDEKLDRLQKAESGRLPDTMTLHSGARISRAKVDALREVINKLLNGDKLGEGTNLAIFKLIKAVLTNNNVLDIKAEPMAYKILLDHGLIDEKGKVPSDTAAVVKSSFYRDTSAENERYSWRDAYKLDKQQRERLIQQMTQDHEGAKALASRLEQCGDAGYEAITLMIAAGLTGPKAATANNMVDGNVTALIRDVQAADPLLMAVGQVDNNAAGEAP